MWPELIGAGIGAISGLMSDSSPTSTTQESSSYNNESYAVPPVGAQPIYNIYTAQLQQAAQTPLVYYPGLGYVPASDATQQAWNLQQGAIPYYTGGAEYAAQGVPLYGQGAELMMQGTQPMMTGANMMGTAAGQQQAMLGTANTNYGTLSTAADVANNPYVQAQLDANAQALNEQLTEQWLPAVTEGAVAGKSMGSSRQGIAEGQAIEGTAEALAQANANTMLEAYNQGLAAQQAALGQTGAMLGNQAMPAQTIYQSGQMMGAAGQQAAAAGSLYGQGATQMGTAGNLQQQAAGAAYGTGASQEAYSQAELDAAMKQWEYEQMAPWNQIALTQSALGAYLPYAEQNSSGTSQGTSTAPNPQYQDPMQAALGGAAVGASMGSMFGSYPSSSYPSSYPYTPPPMATVGYTQPMTMPGYYPYPTTPMTMPGYYPYPT